MLRQAAVGWLTLLVALCGCAFLAKKTPTPAAQIDDRVLARVPAPPNERYYLIMFASENALHQPKYSHTWGTLVRAISSPECSEPSLEVQTISWLPTTLEIDATSRHVEPGTNFDLHVTMKEMLRTKQKIEMWGPYEVWHGFAYRFKMQKDYLESGAVGYQCNDMMGEAARLGNGCDCIHAIADMDPLYPRWRYPLAFYGPSATANLVRRFMHSPVTIDARQTHDWLICRLGLNDYPMERRTYRGRIDPYVPGKAGLQDGPSLPLADTDSGKKLAPEFVKP